MTIDEFIEEWCGLRKSGWELKEGTYIRVHRPYQSYRSFCPVLAVAYQRGLTTMDDNYRVLELGAQMGLTEGDVRRIAEAADGFLPGELKARLVECWEGDGSDDR